MSNPESEGPEVIDLNAEAAPVDENVDGAAPAEDAGTEDVAEVVEEIDPLTAEQEKSAGLTADLQRLQAEYLNYKRRVERDREMLDQNAVFKAFGGIITVLDTIELARAAGEVEGGFKAVVEQLEAAVAKAGIERFGAEGDAFDPNLHEALTAMGTDPEVTVTTVKVVARAGYRMGERVVRAAQVLTVEPA